MATPLKLQLEILASGAGRTVGELQQIQQQIRSTAAQAPEIARLAQAMGTNYEAARRFADGLGLTPEAAIRGIARLRELNGVAATSEVRFAALTSELGLNVRQFQALDRASRRAGESGRESSSLLGGGLAEVAFKVNNVVQLFQTLLATARPVYDALIASNEQLNAQILSSQTNLASSTRLFQGGREITDPTEKIQASKGQLSAAIKQIEIDTQSLVGVTSAQVNELFQITLTNAAALNNQSKQFPDAISAATSLTKGWAASLKVVGVPLVQARQEINSIIKGQIDQNSILAKNLNITNEQVRTWQSQGRLVDELNKRLDTFVAGNAIAARSVDGISSNIQDLFERISRNSGEPLLEPLISALAQIEKYLKQNEGAITKFIQSIAQNVGGTAEGVAQAFTQAFQGIEYAVINLTALAQKLFTIAEIGTIATARLLAPIVDLLASIIGKAAEGYDKIARLILIRQYADAEAALEAYRQQLNGTADGVLKLAAELNRAKNAGQPLSAAQIDRAKAFNESIVAQIAAQKQLSNLFPEQQAQREQYIAQLEALKQRLDAASGGLSIQAKELEQLGNTTEQLAKKVADAQRNIQTGGGGDSEVFKKSITELKGAIEQQAALRQIDLDDAAKALEQIRADGRVEVDLQQQAKQSIVKIYQERVSAVREVLANGLTDQRQAIEELEKIRDRAEVKDDPRATAEIRKKAAQQIVAIRKEQSAAELAEIESYKAKVEALQASQNIGEAAADKALTQLKRRELLERLEQNRVLRDNATSDTERAQILADRAKLGADLDKLAADYQQRERQRELAQFDRQLQDLEAWNAQQLISEQEFQAAKTAVRLARNAEEIQQLSEQLDKLGETDIEGRAAINAKISAAQIQRIKILEEGYAAELALAKDAQAKALAVVIEAEQQRAIDLQKLINARAVTLEKADERRNRSQLNQRKAELKQAQEAQAALEKIANAERSPEAERTYQQQVREAKAKTNQAAITLLEAEGKEQERIRNLALKAIEDEVAARTRATDRQLSQLSRLKSERERTAKAAEASAARETATIDIATRALERQNSLLAARNALASARFAAEASGEDLELARVDRAIEIKKQLNDQNLSIQERLQLMKELEGLTGSDRITDFELVKRRIEIEQRQLETKRTALLAEQAAARNTLSLEQQKTDLANQRALIEARIAEFKAKQGIADAQALARQTELNNRKSIEAAELALTQARAQQPGRERDRAIADAENKFALAKTQAQTDTANAAQGIDLARQQADIAAQNTNAALEQIKNQAEIKRVQIETLEVQQKTALEVLKAAENAKQFANEMERAKAASKQVGPQINRGITIPARAGGGSVSSGKPYLVGEKEPELFVPNVSGTILNRAQILKNLGSLGNLNLQLGNDSAPDNRAVIAAIKSLEQTIRSRPPAAIVANFDNADDGQLDKLFALQRSALRV